ncbi:DUF4190 domain-containing protein [Streptomyces cavernicola]|uniref:DUF4190 domain-containing protein n=1 Tax=Streptomyces cavernicola TaxID=3043613 RepID=A0ABT6SE78_9ACTN|nr:DUF4190 domain-containing protein [Streptomyces sp. B-S-A6]MDI3405982.1 DUF4190 domain-containing protein [Streptomyces sp. B-S-A6]
MTAPNNNPGPPSPFGPPPGGQPMAPPPFPIPHQQPQNGLGVTALVLGIIGAVLFFTVWGGVILGVLALIFGLIGLSKARKGMATNKGVALTGTILGGVAIVLSIVWLVVVVMAVKSVSDELEKEADKIASADREPGSGSGSDSGSDEDSAGGDADEPGAADADEPLKFGATHTYDDGVKVTVGKPKPYSPDEFAAGHEDGNVAVRFDVTIVNGGKKTIDVTTALPTLRDAKGADVEMIFDGSNATKPFTGKLLAGKQAHGNFAFSVPADAAKEVRLELGPEVLKYDDAIWTGAAK